MSQSVQTMIREVAVPLVSVDGQVVMSPEIEASIRAAFDRERDLYVSRVTAMAQQSGESIGDVSFQLAVAQKLAELSRGEGQ